jgi:hypothetical protein
MDACMGCVTWIQGQCSVCYVQVLHISRSGLPVCMPYFGGVSVWRDGTFGTHRQAALRSEREVICKALIGCLTGVKKGTLCKYEAGQVSSSSRFFILISAWLQSCLQTSSLDVEIAQIGRSTTGGSSYRTTSCRGDEGAWCQIPAQQIMRYGTCPGRQPCDKLRALLLSSFTCNLEHGLRRFRLLVCTKADY